ncbi:hypothetical protein FQN60_004462 [Etheostoma spectabile]|uniref:Uncharacterized protein n=1 Tax=Etheostoma spectabile TaxID=54343 RepID=A0A5J5CTJ4_9PERO|nr:hypothetical protein FQN60_004462 [Etheostoma spectabile]
MRVRSRLPSARKGPSRGHTVGGAGGQRTAGRPAEECHSRHRDSHQLQGGHSTHRGGASGAGGQRASWDERITTRRGREGQEGAAGAEALR